MTSATVEPVNRTRTTWGMYAAMGVLGFWLNGLGAVLAPLRADLGVSRSQVAFYPSLFAAALMVMGLVGKHVVRVLGRGLALVVSVAAMVSGAVLLTLPVQPLTLVGAVVLGLGCAMTIQLAPVLAATLYGARAPQVNTEANAVSSIMSFLAPLSVAAALVLGAGWRAGYLLLPGIGAVIAFVLLARRERTVDALEGIVAEDSPLATPAQRSPYLVRWFVIVAAVSVEFCCALWAVEAFMAWHRLSTARATALASAFLIGMALGRTFLAAGAARHSTRFLLLRHIGVAAVGFVLFWGSPWWPLSVLGLLLTGIGVSLLYPIAQQHAVAAWPDAPDAAAAFGSIASGVAIGGAPFILALLADGVGVRAAYAIVIPVLLVALAILTPLTTRTRPAP